MVMPSAPWFLIQRWRRLLRSYSEFHTTKDTQHRQISYFTVKLPVRELHIVAPKKKGIYVRGPDVISVTTFVAQPTGSTLPLSESVIGYDREANPTTSPYDSAYT